MNENLYKLLRAATDKPLFFAYENGKTPSELYITIHVISTNHQLPAHRHKLDKDGKRTISAYRTALVQLDCYGKNSEQILSDIAMKLETHELIELSVKLNISVSECRDIKQVPINIDGIGWQNRAIMALQLNYTKAAEETLPTI